MGPASSALMALNRRLLAAVQDAADATLPELLREREEVLRQFTVALAAGETVAKEDAHFLQELESRIGAALRQRRDAAFAELAALRRGRTAGSAYRPAGVTEARYVDRQG